MSLPSARLDRAHRSAGLLFLVNGAVFANLLPRLPEIKDAFDLSNTAYGFVVVAFPLGSIVAGTAPAPILRRWGSGPVAVVGSVLIAVLMALAGIAGGLGGSTLVLVAYVVPLMIAGMLDAIVDTAQNAQALEVQRALGRSILNTQHALWSLGAMIGGLMGAGALTLHIPLPIHLALSGTIFSLLVLWAGRHVLTPLEMQGVSRDPDLPGLSEQDTAGVDAAERSSAHHGKTPQVPASSPEQSRRGRTGLTLALIASVAITGVMAEDLGQNWSALYVRQELQAPLQLAGLGLVALTGAQFVGRLLGDRMVDRLGRVALARLGALGIGVGITAVIVAPSIAVAVAGFAVAGFSSATLVPGAYQAADEVPGLRPGTGLAVVSWLMRGSFLSLSPLLGLLSDAVGLRMAFALVPLTVLVAVAAAGSLEPSRRTGPR